MKRRSMTMARRPLRTWLVRVFAAMTLMAAIGVGFGLSIPSAHAQEPAGSVTITSEPAGAGVLINGRRMGITPFDLSMADGSELTVSVEMDGFQAFTTTVTVKAGDTKKIHAVLGAAPVKAADSAAPPTE